MYRWLDSGLDDGLIEREIHVVHYVQTPPPQEPVQDEPGFYLFLPAETASICVCSICLRLSLLAEIVVNNSVQLEFMSLITVLKHVLQTLRNYVRAFQKNVH